VALLGRAVVRLLPAIPKSIVRRLSARYIAGTALDDAVRVVRRLNDEGKLATIDVLGEEIHNRDEARGIARAYCEAFARIESERLDSNVSIKLTALGLGLDYAFCREQVADLCREARVRGNFVRIDMEDSSTTDATLRVYRDLRAESCNNAGVVLQARLRRTLSDIPGLDNVRICKGIYLEPEDVAYQGYEEVRASFVRCLEALLAQGSYVGIATHDEYLLGESLRLIREHGLGRDAYEFQMLLGVRPELGDRLVGAGHRLRIYVPYGQQWYEYSLRRLQENPSIAGYIASDTFGRLLHRNGH
jgi:proline dehydrogenase